MIWVLLIYATWCLVALLLMGSMVRAQQADVDWRIAEKVDEVLDQLRGLETKSEESAAIITGLQDQIDELDRVMRTAFEEIGVSPPPRRVLLRANAIMGVGSISAAVLVVGGSRMVRLRRWIQRQARRIWIRVWGE